MSSSTDIKAPAEQGGQVTLTATAVAPSRRGTSALVLSLRNALPPLIVFVVIIAVWYLIRYLLPEGQKFVLPTPDAVLTEGVFDPQTMGDILESAWHTTQVAITGLAIAAVLGITWAIAMSTASWVQRSTYAYAVVLQTIPILAIVPLIGIWFGYEFNARVVVCVMISLFPMVANTLFGLQSVERSMVELFKLQKASPLVVLTKLKLPAALPSIFVGLRTSAGLSVVGAIVGDFFFQRGTPGLGSLISTYTRLLNMSALFAAIFVAALLGIVMFAVFGLLSKLAVGRWYDATR
ncbi:ABC transporter permease [Nocardioides sp. GY 10127]|uniref:ABC transporter permease n=1 Tax=Nocardioides sp. GY 10127 TaxID=2569762 RepID=UPI0010A8AA1A|nr:ABC transporter permease [Nocardioides sp. GY 10127]TIC81927.1 ABC transporter permease [Nocardioides sp. GY 10127]